MSSWKIALFFLALVLFLPMSVFAQSSSSDGSDASVEGVDSGAAIGIAHMIHVKNANVQDGSILSLSQGGAAPSTRPYDSQILGIVARNAGIILSSSNDTQSVPVISDGTTYALVSSQKGNIKKGDIITSSTIPGIGVKADESGYVLGNALEDYASSDPKKTGKIAISLNLHYFNAKPTFSGTLTDILKIALLPTNNSPSAIFKYVVAAIVVLGSFVLGFLTFGRTAAKGVEALGRNPSASAVIHLGIILNVIIVIAIVLAGLTVAFFIIRL
jgi:F0F1-type ATP synthase membrane subunit c/vacuolar-type H+-ATPase subunit K